MALILRHLSLRLQTAILFLKFFEVKETYLWFVNYSRGDYES